MAKKGILGKIVEAVTPNQGGQDEQRIDGGEDRGGLLGKAVGAIKDRFDGDEKREELHSTDAPRSEKPTMEQPLATAGTPAYESGTASATPSAVDTVTAGAAGTAGTGTATAGTDAGYGQRSGRSTGREYVTRDGDTLEAIGAYFYGDPIHAQRLLDDNPQLQGHSGPLPAGMRLKVSDDASRGDASENGGY